MTVRIPISADASSVTTAIDRIRDALRRAGQEGRDFSKLDLSHPELRDFAADLRRIQDQVENLTRTARGATAATARHVAEASGYDGRNGSPFAPGGMFDPMRWQQQRPDDWRRHYVNAGRYILQGTQFAPPQPPAHPPGQPPVQPPSNQGNPLNNMGNSTMSAAAGLMRGFIPAMLAMAGLSAIGNMASQGVQQATSEAISTDRLLRTLRDLDTDFDKLRNTVADTTQGLGLTYEEAQKLASTWTTLANSTNAEEMRTGIRFSAGFARGYGMDPNAVAGGLARSAFLHEDPRRFATILADAISASGLTGRPTEVMESLLRFQEQNARRIGPANGTELYAQAYSAMSSSGIAGLRGAGGEALLGQIDRAVMAGGARGEASQFLTWRALSRHGNRDVFRQQWALEGGMFGGVNGGEAGPGNPTNIEAMMQELTRIYPESMGATPNGEARRYLAIGGHLGITGHQAQAWDQARRRQGFGHFAAALRAANMQISDLREENIRDASEIAKPGADLERWRTNIKARLGANDPGRARLDSVQGEDLRRELLRTLMQVSRSQNEGTAVQQSIATFTNALTQEGRGLLPVLGDMRDVLSTFTTAVSALTQNMADGYLAMFGNPEERAAARARMASRVGGGSPLPNTPGGNLPPTAMSDPERAEAANALYRDARVAGFDHNHAAALVAQVDVESGFNPNATHDGNTGFGLLGWNNNGERAGNPGRLTNLGFFIAARRGIARPASYAEATTLARTATAEEQRAFYLHEVGPNGAEHGNARIFRNAQSAGEAAAALSRDVVRPLDRVGNMQRRGALAERYANTLPNPDAAPAPTASGTPVAAAPTSAAGGTPATAAPAGTPAPAFPPVPAAPAVTPGEAALMGLTGIGPHNTPAPGGVQADPPPPAGVRGTPVPIIERPLSGPVGGQQAPVSFQPLRVVVENGRGDTISDQFLALHPPTGSGPPRPWGAE